MEQMPKASTVACRDFEVLMRRNPGAVNFLVVMGSDGRLLQECERIYGVRVIWLDTPHHGRRDGEAPWLAPQRFEVCHQPVLECTVLHNHRDVEGPGT